MHSSQDHTSAREKAEEDAPGGREKGHSCDGEAKHGSPLYKARRSTLPSAAGTARAGVEPKQNLEHARADARSGVRAVSVAWGRGADLPPALRHTDNGS